ncbi:MAG TPA: spore coat U domain-containing protein [Polyangiaceae bacterium]|nr:spore coat U domain-containing protein [Polyangiaceae bacterium]
MYFGQSAGHTIVVSSPVIGNNTVTYYCELDAGQTLVAGNYTDSSVNTMMMLSGSTPSGNSSASLVAQNSCDLSVTTNVGFGAYAAIGTNASTPLNATGVILVACTSGAPYTLTLDQGTYAASGSTTSVPKRQMASGTYRLPYFLYQNAGYSTVWGDTGGTAVGATGTGGYVNYTIYGRFPPGRPRRG